MADRVSRKIAGEQEDAQAAARNAILKKITSDAPSVGNAAALQSLAEAYALVVAPERVTRQPDDAR